MLLAVDGASGMVSEFTSIFTSVFSMITSNWALSLFIIVPLGCAIVGAVISLINRRCFYA